MKKIYNFLCLALIGGMIASCSNDINNTADIIPEEVPSVSETRAFPEDDGAQTLTGLQPAEKLLKILKGADDQFSRRMANYGEPNRVQYNEIKTLADSLVKGAANDGIKYRRIFNWITENINYGNASNEPYDVYIYKKAICQGYANLLNLMLYTQGIPVINSNGYLNSNGFYGHAWNYVYLVNSWWLSDPTNSLDYKADLLSEYQDMFIPMSADGNFLENDVYAYNYTNENLNLNTVKVAEDAFVVPFSVTLNNGEKYQINSFNPTTNLPENVTEVYIGKNIISLGADGTYGLRNHAPNVEAAHVDPANKYLESYEGVVYQAYNDEPLYIPTAMKVLYLKPTANGIVGKNFVYNHPNVEELYIPEGTKSLENWAVENCPNLKVAYLPLDTEYTNESFVKVHANFQVVRMDMTGIKDAIAD